MLETGAPAPDFTLRDDAGDTVSLGDLLADGSAVLFFYPGDFTPICTREVCLVRDLHSELAAAGVTVAGVSADSVERHARFKAEHGLAYRLLADPDKQVIARYGALGPLGLVRRVSYLVGTDRRIQDRLRADFRLSRHARFLERAARRG